MVSTAATLAPMAKRQQQRPTRPAGSEAEASQISARISRDVLHALKRATVEQQVAGKVPNSQQGIVQTALVEWLNRNGYL